MKGIKNNNNNNPTEKGEHGMQQAFLNDCQTQ